MEGSSSGLNGLLAVLGEPWFAWFMFFGFVLWYSLIGYFD